MKRFVSAALLWSALVAPAFTAEAPKEFTLKLTPEEMNYIGTILNDRPLKEAMPLFIKLQNQIAAQQQEINAPPPENGGSSPQKAPK